MFTLTSLRNVAPWTALAMFVSGCAPSGDKPSSVLEETSFEDDFGFVRFAPIGPCDPRVESGLGGPNKFTIVAWLNKEGELFSCHSSGVQAVDEIPANVNQLTQAWRIQYIKKIVPGTEADPCQQVKTVGGNTSVCWPPL